MNLKPMEYKAKGSFEVLADDNYKGYRFLIVSYGTHPCAYVVLPKTSKFYGKPYDDEIFDDLNFHVHGENKTFILEKHTPCINRYG